MSIGVRMEKYNSNIRHGWHGTFVLCFSHRTSMIFCSPLISKISACALYGVVDVTKGQTDNPHQEDWSESSFFDEGDGHKHGVLWMPLPSLWCQISNTGGTCVEDVASCFISFSMVSRHRISIYEV